MNVKKELDRLSNLFNNGYYDEVINKCKNIIKKFPSEPFFYNLTGLAYKEKNNIIEAESYFQKSIELNPKNEFAYNNRANSKYELLAYEAAISDYTKAIN